MDNVKTRVTPKYIAELVAKELDIPDLSVKERTRDLAQARFIYYKLAKSFCRYVSLAAIGKEINRDHSTVVYGLNKYDVESKYDLYMRDVHDKLYNELDPNFVKPGVDQEYDLTFQEILNRIKLIERKLNIQPYD